MAGGEDADPWTKHDIVSDMNLRYVDEDTVIVGVEIFLDVGMASVIRPERRFHPEAFTYMAE